MDNKRKKLTVVWLVLSSFGIMFAVLSWIQDSEIIPDYLLDGVNKGVLALITGLILYFYVGKKI